MSEEERQNPLFSTNKTNTFFSNISNEIVRIGGQFILYYRINPGVNPYDLYGENEINLSDAVKIPCLWETEQEGADIAGQAIERWTCKVWISRIYLDQKEITIDEGRYFRIGTIWFEVTEVQDYKEFPHGQTWMNMTVYVEGVSVSNSGFNQEDSAELNIIE